MRGTILRNASLLRNTSLSFFIALGVACGGSPTPAEEPDEAPYDEVGQTDSEPPPAAPEGEGEEDAEPAGTKAATAEPEFTEGMSVNDAINAVPQGTERVNLDPEELAEPLKDFKVYEPCKPAANAHWTIRVAIWNGRAVGMDITTKPANKRLEECIREQVKQISWRQKARALNTVEHAY